MSLRFSVRASWAATWAAERDGWEPSTAQTIDFCIGRYLLAVMLAAKATAHHRLQAASPPDRDPDRGRWQLFAAPAPTPMAGQTCGSDSRRVHPRGHGRGAPG